MTLGSELKALDVVNNSRKCLISTTMGRELNALDVINNSRL